MQRGKNYYTEMETKGNPFPQSANFCHCNSMYDLGLSNDGFIGIAKEERPYGQLSQAAQL